MKTKRGKSGTGLRDFVKKSDSTEKMIKVINKKGEAVFEKKSKVKANPNDYKPAEGSPFRKAIKEIMEKREPGGRFSRADIELAKSMLKKRTGGAMLKNPGKADLDKDGKLSGYEKKRGMAIEKAMGAKRGKFAKTRRPKFGDEFSAYNKMRDMMDTQRKMQQRKKDMEKDKQKISEKKKGIAVKSGGMMKYNKGGGADTGKKGELKSKLAVGSDKMKRINKILKKIGGRKAPKRPKLQAPERGPMIPLKAMGGGMMMKPMGYKSGTSVMARGCKLGRKKATKIM